MLSRRPWFLALASDATALAVLVLPVLAEELLGTTESVDPDAKKIAMTEKVTLGDVEVKLTDGTVIETAKGERLAPAKLRRRQRRPRTLRDRLRSIRVPRASGVAEREQFQESPGSYPHSMNRHPDPVSSPRGSRS